MAQGKCGVKIMYHFKDFPEDHLGRVYYSLYYDEIDEALNVYINRIRNLPKSTPHGGKTNKTYIK